MSRDNFRLSLHVVLAYMLSVSVCKVKVGGIVTSEVLRVASGL